MPGFSVLRWKLQVEKEETRMIPAICGVRLGLEGSADSWFSGR